MNFISKTTLLSTIFICSLSSADSAWAQTSMHIVPKPCSVVQTNNGVFEYSKTTDVFVDSQFDSKNVGSILSIYKHLNALFFNDLSFNVRNVKASGKWSGASGSKCITIKKNDALDAEEYKLVVDNKGIAIESATEAGLFYAFQTLMLASKLDNHSSIPYMELTDKPRFEYRGFMLDVSRYFMPKDDVKKIIDCMSMLKLNKLHLHLTDDNGWRIEIKKYPKLTAIGAWAANRNN